MHTVALHTEATTLKEAPPANLGRAFKVGKKTFITDIILSQMCIASEQETHSFI